MLLALTVLLMHPPAVPATVLPRLPLSAPVFSGALLTTGPADNSADSPSNDDKSAAGNKAAADKKSAATKASDSKAAVTKGAFPPAVVFQNAANVMVELSAPAVSPDPTAYQPGQIVPTPVDSDAAGFSSSRSAGEGFASAASFRRVESAGRARVMPPKKWFILSATAHGAATFDAWSTRRVIMSGAGQEMNPMLKPFANSNALFAAVQVAPLAFDYLSLRMMRNSHPFVRKMWWVPQTASAVSSFAAGAHNMTVH